MSGWLGDWCLGVSVEEFMQRQQHASSGYISDSRDIAAYTSNIDACSSASRRRRAGFRSQSPWMVTDQALVETWRPWFYPSPTRIRTALVWMKMPHLPMELWGSATLWSIVGLVGEDGGSGSVHNGTKEGRICKGLYPIESFQAATSQSADRWLEREISGRCLFMRTCQSLFQL